MSNANRWFKTGMAGLRHFAAVAFFAMGAFTVGVTQAATPPAGSSIGNQASATYTDASAISRTATSNTVSTIVQQVASLTLTQAHSVTAAPGAPLSFSHQITNTGNGSDSFNLSILATSGTILTAAVFYIDGNCDGVADNATSITSVGPVAAGASACFVATTNVSGGATNGQTGSFTVQAASAFTPATTATNLDDVTVTSKAVISVNKSSSLPSGGPGSTITYTLTYSNSGNNPASNVILSDAIPAGTTYVAGSGIWSGGGALTDAAAGDPAGINYDYNVTAAGVVTAVITSVASGQSGTLKFDVTVNAGATPGTINNTGYYCYNDGAAQVPAGSTSANCSTTGTPTGTVPFTVNQTAAVVLDDVVSTTDATGADDVVRVDAAAQGSTVLFDTVVHNNGNGTDTFNITMSGSTFPAGTTFALYKAGGVPMTDSNADGTLDTGPVAAAGTYHVWVYATLPASASGGGAYDLTVTAKSVFDPTKTDPTTAELGTITANTVDVTNDVAVGGGAANGDGATGATVIRTNSVNPGASTKFTLVVNNTSGVADNYTLSTTTVLPSGWTVSFAADGGAGDCTTTGATISNTGTVLAGSAAVVCAVVTTAAGSTAGNNDLTFQALSPISAASDTITDRVTINSLRSISLTPINTGQIFAGGSKVYPHVLTNTGTVTEDSIGLSEVLSGATTSWGVVIYDDTGTTPGVLDGSDAVISSVASLAPGASVNLFVKVIAPVSAAAGDIDTATLTATGTTCTGGTCATTPPAAPTSSTTDTSTVIAGQVSLTKLQALDAACDGTADAAFSSSNITTGAVPGACIMYQITAQNLGAANVDSLVVSDATPSNTTYDCPAGAGAAAITGAGSVNTVTNPASCGTGTISATVGTLTPGASGVLTFSVQINP